MRYKLIAIDLDDTLLDSNLRISKQNQEAIQQAREKGVQVVLCSGRASISVLPYLKLLDLQAKGEYAITYNGAAIIEAETGTPIYQKKISLADAKEFIGRGKQYQVDVQTYIRDQLIVEQITSRIVRYGEMTGMTPIEVGDIGEYVKEGVIKILFNGDHENLIEIKKDLEEAVKDKLHMFFSKPNYLEFTNIEANKGLTIVHLSAQLGIAKEEMICIGDSYNDLYMIEEAGLGVAVANAHPEIKRKADYITRRNHNEHAIKEVIDRFIFNR